jgi:hypothetical protein
VPYFTGKLQKIMPACEIDPDRRRAGEKLVRGSNFSHKLQEFFANPRQHLCQSSQLFHVEQFGGVFVAWNNPRHSHTKPQSRRRLPELFHVEHFEVT